MSQSPSRFDVSSGELVLSNAIVDVTIFCFATVIKTNKIPLFETCILIYIFLPDDEIPARYIPYLISAPKPVYGPMHIINTRRQIERRHPLASILTTLSTYFGDFHWSTKVHF